MSESLSPVKFLGEVSITLPVADLIFAETIHDSRLGVPSHWDSLPYFSLELERPYIESFWE
jgi:hypothetical protein